jgi:hypothetical protein
LTWNLTLYLVRMPAEISLEGELQIPDNYPHGKHHSNLDVKELEMLLEPYFVQVDGTLNKLSTVCKAHLTTQYSLLGFLFFIHLN